MGRRRGLYLLCDRIVDRPDQVADLVAHRLRRDTCGGRLEVHLTLPSETSRLATWHERIHAVNGGEQGVVVVVAVVVELTWCSGG